MLPKIALEEHVLTAALAPYAAGNRPTKNDAVFAELRRRLADFGATRLEATDEAGITFAVLSATVPGVQSEPEPGRAVALARQANDELAQEVRKQPARYGGFAALPLQDPAAAADELERTVRDLGSLGAMINGHTLGHYLDEDQPRAPGRRHAACRTAALRHHQTSCVDYDERRVRSGRARVGDRAPG